MSVYVWRFILQNCQKLIDIDLELTQTYMKASTVRSYDLALPYALCFFALLICSRPSNSTDLNIL